MNVWIRNWCLWYVTQVVCSLPRNVSLKQRRERKEQEPRNPAVRNQSHLSLEFVPHMNLQKKAVFCPSEQAEFGSQNFSPQSCSNCGCFLFDGGCWYGHSQEETFTLYCCQCNRMCWCFIAPISEMKINMPEKKSVFHFVCRLWYFYSKSNGKTNWEHWRTTKQYLNTK